MGVDARQWFRAHGLLWVVLVFGATIRLVWWFVGPEVIENEGALYARVAENLINGRGFTTIYGLPETMYTLLYSVMIAGAMLVTGEPESGARLVSLVVGTATIIPVYFIALTIHGRTSAIFAAVLVAVSPLLVGVSTATYTEGPYMLFIMSGSYFVLRASEFTHRRYAWFAGLCWGLAYLTRPEGIAYAFLTVAALFLAALFTRKPLVKIVAPSAIVFGVVAVLALPYVLYLKQATGEYRLEGKNLINHTIIERMDAGMNYHEASWGIDESLTDVGPLLVPNHYATYSPYPVALGEVLATLPKRVMRNFANYDQEFLPLFTYGGPILLSCLFLGLFRTAWTRERATKELVYGTMVSFAVLIILAAHAIWFRYTLPLFMFMMVWCGHGAREFCDWAASTAGNVVGADSRWKTVGRDVWWIAAAGLVAAFVLISAQGTQYVDEVAQGFGKTRTMKEAGLWIREQDKTAYKVIMDVRSTVPFYAGGIFSGLPYASSELTLRYVEKINPDYIVIWSGTAHMRPYLEDWLARGIPSERAELLHRIEDGEDNRVVIYRWRK